MSIQADVEGVLSLANILLVALPAFDEVDDVPRLAGGRGASVVASPGGCAPDGCSRLHVVIQATKQEMDPCEKQGARSRGIHPGCWREGTRYATTKNAGQPDTGGESSPPHAQAESGGSGDCHQACRQGVRDRRLEPQ